MRLLQIINHLLFPEKCVLCGKLLDGGETDLCRTCRTDAPVFPGGRSKRTFLDSWNAVWYYEDNPRNSLLRYKFGGRRGYAKVYGQLLAMKLLQEHPEGFDVLTWIPVSRLRKLTRGFDQVELLAQHVGRELGMEAVALLKKIRHNRPQSSIAGEAQRRANVLGVYRVTDPALVAGKRILLLDDIITTGATAGEAGRILLTAGGKEVHFGAVAAARHRSKNK